MKLIVIFFIVVCAFCARAAHASYLDASLEELMQIKLTSSTLTEKNLATVPSSITVFTRAQIQAMGLDTLTELLNFVPGFQTFRQGDAGNEYYHSVRGRRTGTSSREVLILIDGQRFQNELYVGPYTPMIFLSNIEKVEVIRGPGSSLYGSNAFTGVINITTQREQNKLAASYGDHQRAYVDMQFFTELKNYKIELGAKLFNDQGQAYLLENASLNNTGNRTQVASRDPYSGYDVQLKVAQGEAQLSLAHYAQQAQDYYLLEKTSNHYNETELGYSAANFKHALIWSDTLDTHYQLNYGHFSKFTQAELIPPYGNSTYDETSFGISVHNNWVVDDKQSVQFGAERRHIESDALNLASPALAVPVAIGEAYARDVTGVYVQHQSQPFNAIELTLGARFDDYSNIGSSFSPRLGVVYQVTEQQFLKVLYGQAFRAPAFGDLILTNNNAVLGNKDLKPETIATWELIWGGVWAEHSLTATLFDSKVADAIVQGSGTVRKFINSASDENSQGLELEYMTQINEQWQLRAHYTYFNSLPVSAFRQSDRLAALILNYQHHKWNFNLAANRAGERKMLTSGGAVRVDSYWLANAKIQYALSSATSLAVQAKNILDEDYLTPPQGNAFSSGLPNRGRELSVSFDWAL